VYATNLDTGVEKYQLVDMTRTLSMPYKVLGRIDTQLALANPDQWLITGGKEGKARLWNTSTGQIIATLKHPSEKNFVLLGMSADVALADGELVQAVDVSHQWRCTLHSISYLVCREAMSTGKPSS
jgi:WD40 repeat protein